ncbi:MAG: AI-2E family transporter [Elusimicrobia bacterium]|nr:AI-2E family transporter [Elusimicrobiota bacterium]
MQAIITPFLLAFLAAYLANPLITFFEHQGLRRKAVVILFYVLLGLVCAGTVAGFTPLVSREIEELQINWLDQAKSLEKAAKKAAAHVGSKLPAGRKAVPFIEEKAQKAGAALLGKLPDIASGLAGFLALFFLVPFIAFFFLTEGPGVFEEILEACPGRHVEKVLHIFCSIGESLGDYLRALFLDCLIIAVMAAIGLYAIGLDYYLTLGILTGISGMVPYVGPVVIGALSAGLAAVQFQGLAAAINVVFLFIGLRFADDWILQPYIMSRAGHLHPVIFLFALMAGGHWFGILGLILAAPAACVLKVIFSTLVEWYMTEAGLKKQPRLSEEEILVID